MSDEQPSPPKQLIALIALLAGRAVEVAANAYVQRIIVQHQTCRLPDLIPGLSARLLPEMVGFAALLKSGVIERTSPDAVTDAAMNFAVEAGTRAADVAMAAPLDAPAPADVPAATLVREATGDALSEAKAAAEAAMREAVKKAREP